MEATSQDEDLAPNESNNGNFNSDELTSPEVLIEQLKIIAESGEVETNWSELQNDLKLRLKSVLDSYIERNEFNCKDEHDQEPNVEEFNLENSRDDILELIASFSEPPFTIQRICELLHSPFKYYDRTSTFLRGLEKNLRVISSNNWPKSPFETSKQDKELNKLTRSTPQHQECAQTDTSPPPPPPPEPPKEPSSEPKPEEEFEEDRTSGENDDSYMSKD